MKKDNLYVAAVCKSREKNLIGKERLDRMTDCDSGEDGLRILKEAQFGGDTQIDGAYDFEKLIAYETNSLYEFLKEYCPNDKFLRYCFAERDFHNAEVLLRSKKLRLDKSAMLLPDGYLQSEDIEKCIDDRNYSSLPKHLTYALKTTDELFENGEASGYKISDVFAKSLNDAKLYYSSFNKKLHALCVWETDAKNIAISLRSGSFDKAKDGFLKGGKLSETVLKDVFDKNFDKLSENKEFKDYTDLIDTFSRLNAGEPLIGFEQVLNGHALKELKKDKYEVVDGIQPLILYYYYRLNEIANVRTIMVGLNNGIDKEQIKQRVRENYAG